MERIIKINVPEGKKAVYDEVQYIFASKEYSKGQISMWLTKKLFSIASKKYGYQDIFNEFINEDGSFKKFHCNNTWEQCYKAQIEYYLSFPKALSREPGTFLFDEIDKSFDIVNIDFLYTTIFPEFIKKTGIQVIIISHSPIVLLDKIKNNKAYNFISIDRDYTEKCKQILK